MFNTLKRLSYRPELIRVIDAVGLRGIMRQLYYYLNRPLHGILWLEAGGIAVKFYVRNAGELRVLDPNGRAQGELEIIERLLSILHPGDIVYDVGANVGLYTLLLAKAGAEVIAFEPEDQSYEHLLANIQLNELTKVKVFKKALGSCSSTQKLYLGWGNADSSLIRPPTGREMGYQTVEVIEGDLLRRTENLLIPRIIKIDVEGYEYEVLKGLRETLTNPIAELLVCEVHPALLPEGVSSQKVLTLIESLGFDKIDIRRRKDTFHILAGKSMLKPR